MSNSNLTKQRFTLGQVLATPGALEALAAAGEDLHEFLSRHARGDWGDLDSEDAALNDQALADGSRILSSYPLSDGKKIWIITEATDEQGHRAATTALLPEEY